MSNYDIDGQTILYNNEKYLNGVVFIPVLKCKICSTQIPIQNKKDFVTCTHCGTAVTIPEWTDDSQADLYNSAAYYRQNGEFEKAAKIYETILIDQETAAEAHWGLLLCQLGIQYMEDVKKRKWIPICHRPQPGTLLKEPRYLATLQYAKGYARTLYMREAVQLDKIQQEILETAKTEEPYDLYLCCKGRDENGRRTKDSLLAERIYDELLKRKYRVFFAQMTLEKKQAGEFQPYLYAALHSARILVAVGTKPEHFQAAWFKNEWKSYLNLMREDGKKLLIPVYRDMDPHELPEELMGLQAQDVGKNGILQEVICGIENVLDRGKTDCAGPVDPPVQQTFTPQDCPLKKAYRFLEDGDFDAAKSCFYSVLEHRPRESRAFWGLLLCEKRCKTAEMLVENQVGILEGSRHYQRAIQFSEEKERRSYLQIEARIVSSLQAVCQRVDQELNELRRKKKLLREQREGFTGNTVVSRRESLKLQQEFLDEYTSSMKQIELERQEELERLKGQLRKKEQEYARMPLLSFRGRDQIEKELEFLERKLEETNVLFDQRIKECRRRGYEVSGKQIQEMWTKQNSEKLHIIEAELKGIQQKIAFLQQNEEYLRCKKELEKIGKYTPQEDYLEEET